jgi:hypothetical protein
MHLHEDFIDVPVSGSFTASIPNNKINFENGEFVVNDVNFTFDNSPMFLTNNTVKKDGVKFKPLCFSANNSVTDKTSTDLYNFSDGSKRINLYNLYSTTTLDIPNSNKDIIARSVLWLVAISPITVSTREVSLDGTSGIKSITGYFEGYITLTGIGLLNLLPTQLKLNTSYSEIDKEFTSLISSIRDLLNKYGSRNITRLLWYITIKIPSIILAMSDQIKDICVSECKDVESELKKVLANLKDIVSSFPTSNTDDIGVIYKVSTVLSVINRLFGCKDDICDTSLDDDDSPKDKGGKDKGGKDKGGKDKGGKDKGGKDKGGKDKGGKDKGGKDKCDSDEDSNSSDSSNIQKPDNKDKKDKTNDNVILKKLSDIESQVSSIKHITNTITNRVSEQDKIIRKIVECVLKK